MKKFLIAITGASGAIHGIKLLESLRPVGNVETHLILSETAEWTIPYETEYSIKQVRELADHSYSNNHMWEAPASGSFYMDAMVICPCSMKTISAIRIGFADNLITRSADVFIKESRKLILCPRETPLSAIHLDNMSYLAHLGICILPPMTSFYTKPTSIDDIVNHHVMKIFDQLNINYPNGKRWQS
ncbi:MAG: UbiX family flavin prenyltransferase [Eubacteriales bacterium]|nr:UbiX family flavin prenyltransferase [Eubacteriales bacterium]